MDFFPDELDLISLFCIEPIKLDKSLPFFYNQSTFAFENDTESFVVIVSPSYSEFVLEVKNKTNGELVAYHSFKTVGKLEILSNKINSAKILLILDGDRGRFITTVEITLRPQFSFIIKEHFSDK